MGCPIMTILSIVFGMALLAILYTAFANPIKDMGSNIIDKSNDILNSSGAQGQTVTSTDPIFHKKREHLMRIFRKKRTIYNGQMLLIKIQENLQF